MTCLKAIKLKASLGSRYDRKQWYGHTQTSICVHV